jgi:hypothetical protein
MTSTGPILIAHDGSKDARHAIDYAAAIRPGADAVGVPPQVPIAA